MVEAALNVDNSSQNLAPTVRNVLEAWSGYPVIGELLNIFPGLGIYLAGGLLRDIF